MARARSQWRTRWQRARWGLGGLLLVGGMACGGDGTDPGPVLLEFPGTFVGTVDGTDAGEAVNSPATLTITQSGQTLSGTWATLGASGTFNGETCDAGNSCYTFVLTQTQPCNGIFSGEGNASSQSNQVVRLTGTYTGSYCGGTVDATFALDRQ